MKYCESIGHDHDVSALPTERVISVSKERWTMIFIIIFRRGQLTRMERSINQTSTQPEVDRRIFQWLWWCLPVVDLTSNISDRGLYVWGEIGDSLCVAVCCVGVCAYVPSQLKHSRQGSLCLSWDRGQSVCGCVCVSTISAQTFETGHHLPAT